MIPGHEQQPYQWPNNGNRMTGPQFIFTWLFKEGPTVVCYRLQIVREAQPCSMVSQHAFSHVHEGHACDPVADCFRVQ